jgi:uncharacterized protein YlxW (UPF0749 family)
MSATTAEGGIDPQVSSPGATDVAPAVTQRTPEHGWVWQVTALSAVLGVLLALAVRTTAHIRKTGLPESRFGISGTLLSVYHDDNERLQKEIKSLRKQVNEYEQNVQSETRSTELLKEQLQEVKALAGLVPVKGPGLRITLTDSPVKPLPGLPPEEYEGFRVHDSDLNGLINELKASGAEALAMSGADPNNLQRVIVTSAARCVGSTAIVNGTQLSAPYTILAIGNPKELHGALDMPEGFVQSRGLNVLKMIEIAEEKEIVLPEYSGRISPRYIRPATTKP